MDTLDKLPPKLDVLYDAALKRIDMQAEEHAALAKRVLLWVAYAYRPLTVTEMQYAVATDKGVGWRARGNLVLESLMISVCCGLVVVEEEQHSSRKGILRPGPANRIFRLVRQSPFYS
jgi:hypothetical protein